MAPPPQELLKTAVLILGTATIVTSAGIFVLMEIRFNRLTARQVRRILLESRLLPLLDENAPQMLWSKISKADQEIIEEILVDQTNSPSVRRANAVRSRIIALGIFDRWLWDLRGGTVKQQMHACVRIGAVHDPRGVDALVAAVKDPSRLVRMAVVVSLGRLKDPRGIAGLMEVAQAPERVVPDLTLAAALAACAENDPALLSPLLKSRGTRARVIAAWALSEIADARVLPNLLPLIADSDPEVRGKSARALARIHNPQTIEALAKLATDPVWFVRVRAMDALGRLGDPAGESIALKGLEDPVREVRYRAASALRQISGMKCGVAMKVLATASRRGFSSLISEWEHSGFLLEVVRGLSPAQRKKYRESLATVQFLISNGACGALVNFVLVFPARKIRLRLVRLLSVHGSPSVRAALLDLPA